MNLTVLSPMDIGVVLSTLTTAAQEYMVIADRNRDMPDIMHSMRERARTLMDVAARVEIAALNSNARQLQARSA
jgi:hypothetical protein